MLVLVLGILGCPDRPLQRAFEDLQAGRFEEAGDAFFREARHDPAHLAAWDGAVEVWCRRAVHVARCLEVLDAELELLGSVERHRDALSHSLETRARARLQSGLVDAALSDLERAAKAAPERSSVPVAEARGLVMLGRREAAIEALERARRLDPRNPEIEEVLRLLPGAGRPTPAPPQEGFGGTE